MDTQKVSTTKLLQRIERELNAFVHPGRRKVYAQWLAEQCDALKVKALRMDGQQVEAGDETPRGEGVPTPPTDGNANQSNASRSNPQSQSRVGTMILEMAGTKDPQMPEISTLNASGTVGGQIDAAETQTLNSGQTIQFPAKLDASVPVQDFGPTQKGPWPLTAVVNVFAACVNPRFLRCRLEDGREVTMEVRRGCKYRRQQPVKCRRVSTEMAGTPIYAPC